MRDSYLVRKVTVGDHEQFFSLKLHALRTDPDSFVATMEEEERMTPEDVQQYLSRHYVLGAFTKNGELVGTLVFMEQERRKFKHIGILGGMYVHPSHRGRGLAKKLLAVMLENLKKNGHLYALQLKVVTTNDPAIRLYESFGFSVWATEKNGLFHDGVFFDQHHMALRFCP